MIIGVRHCRVTMSFHCLWWEVAAPSPILKPVISISGYAIVPIWMLSKYLLYKRRRPWLKSGPIHSIWKSIFLWSIPGILRKVSMPTFPRRAVVLLNIICCWKSFIVPDCCWQGVTHCGGWCLPIGNQNTKSIWRCWLRSVTWITMNLSISEISPKSPQKSFLVQRYGNYSRV